MDIPSIQQIQPKFNQQYFQNEYKQAGRCRNSKNVRRKSIT